MAVSLTATELARFMVCNGSSFLNGVEPFRESTEIAEEGNAAHWVVEQCFKTGQLLEEYIDRQAPNGYFITAEMVEYVSNYLDFIRSVTSGEVETNTSWATIRGRADFVGFDGNTMIVADLKYGWRIVEPDNNWTLISHAIAALRDNVTEIVFQIHQPRPFHPKGNVRIARMDRATLLQKKQEIINALENPKQESISGIQCVHCKCFTQCPAAQTAIMNAIDAANYAFDSELDGEQLGWMLKTLKRAKEVINQAYDAYEDLAFQRLSKSQTVKGYQMVDKIGNRTWTGEPEDVINYLKIFCNIDVTKKAVVTPAQAIKMGVPESVIETCTHRPCIGSKLVEMDDNDVGEKLFGKKG